VIVFFFSNTKKTKDKKRKTRKKNQKKGRSLPLSSHSILSLLAIASTLLFRFLLPFFSFQVEEKKNKEKKP